MNALHAADEGTKLHAPSVPLTEPAVPLIAPDAVMAEKSMELPMEQPQPVASALNMEDKVPPLLDDDMRKPLRGQTYTSKIC
jgi:hypothetical protein